MKPPSPALFASKVILAITVCFRVIWCQQTNPYDVCGQSVQCGNIQIHYPFWGVNRPAYCGLSGFELTCQSNVPILHYESLNYRVLQINNSAQTITIARDDLWNNSCPQYLYNTTYNSTLFNRDYFDQANVSLFYGCNSSLINLSDRLDIRFSCIINDTQNDSYFLPMINDTNIFSSTLGCKIHITVPVHQSWVDQFAAGPTDLRSALTAGFNLQWMANNEECDDCIRSEGRCGSTSTSPELFACYCANENFSLTCKKSRGSKGPPWTVIIGFSCGGGVMLLFLVIIFWKKRLQQTRESANYQIEIFIRDYKTLAPKRYKYAEIKRMTNSFQQKLGKGGYGSVYKGQLPDGELVAVKLLAGPIGDGEDFINEVASISRTSHVNIVTLLGFCIEGKKRALIYEFMPNGSLDKFLRGDGSHLDWTKLFEIAKGIARGLEYLHRGCNTRIVHFDIKPHNILLDEGFVPKIADFGLAKLCKKKESIVSVTGARGTAGYIAPEVYFKSLGGASHKSDVYSYGMMILEMTGARKNMTANLKSTSEAYFPDWIYKQVEAGDNLGVDGVTTEEEDELARKMVTVSLWCIQSDPSDRPSISKVMEMLEGSFESLQIPPRRFC